MEPLRLLLNYIGVLMALWLWAMCMFLIVTFVCAVLNDWRDRKRKARRREEDAVMAQILREAEMARRPLLIVQNLGEGDVWVSEEYGPGRICIKPGERAKV